VLAIGSLQPSSSPSRTIASSMGIDMPGLVVQARAVGVLVTESRSRLSAVAAVAQPAASLNSAALSADGTSTSTHPESRRGKPSKADLVLDAFLALLRQQGRIDLTALNSKISKGKFPRADANMHKLYELVKQRRGSPGFGKNSATVRKEFFTKHPFLFDVSDDSGKVFVMTVEQPSGSSEAQQLLNHTLASASVPTAF